MAMGEDVGGSRVMVMGMPVRKSRSTLAKKSPDCEYP